MAKIKTRTQMHCAQAVELLVKYKQKTNEHSPKVLKAFVKLYFLEKAKDLELTYELLDSLVGAVLGMAAKKESRQRINREFGIENMLTMLSLENDTRERQKADWHLRLTSDPVLIDQDEVDSIKNLLATKASDDLLSEEDIDFAAMLEARAEGAVSLISSQENQAQENQMNSELNEEKRGEEKNESREELPDESNDAGSVFGA